MPAQQQPLTAALPATTRHKKRSAGYIVTSALFGVLISSFLLAFLPFVAIAQSRENHTYKKDDLLPGVFSKTRDKARDKLYGENPSEKRKVCAAFVLFIPVMVALVGVVISQPFLYAYGTCKSKAKPSKSNAQTTMLSSSISLPNALNLTQVCGPTRNISDSSHATQPGNVESTSQTTITKKQR